MFSATRCRINYQGHATKLRAADTMHTATDESNTHKTQKEPLYPEHDARQLLNHYISFRPIVPVNHKAERTERNHVCSHSLQNQLPRTRHEASAADTMHLDRRG